MAALEDQAYIQDNIHRILSDKLQLQEQLEGLGLQVYPSATNFLFVNTQPLNLPSAPLVAALQERNIWVADFGNTPGLGAYYFRIAVGTPAENQGFLQGLADALLSLS